MNRYKEFDKDQQEEIQLGMYKGLDISCYAKPEFMAIQMRQIRLGLEEDLDVTVYNKVEYDWFQMEEIRKGLKAGIHYEAYADPSIDYKKMRQIRKGLQSGIDLTKFIRLDAGILEELRKAILAKVSIVEYIKEGYRVEQLAQIRLALEKKLDIHPYINVEYLGASIREIAIGLEEGIPVSLYANIDYSWQQMREIRLGLEARLDVTRYNNSLYSWQQMREIRLGMEEGLDVSQYSSFIYTAGDMERIRLKMLDERIEDIISDATAPEEINEEELFVFVSRDEMEASIEVRCDETVELSENDIRDCLWKHGICQGILDDEIQGIVADKKYNSMIVIAKGEPAKRGEDGKYEFYFNTNPVRTPKIMPDGSADFRGISWFETVEKGQMIARYFPAKEGKGGYTVTGKALQPKKGKEKNMLTGSGFELLPDGVTYRAAMDGKIDLVGETRLEISRLCILDKVNLTTGNINFDGSVYVKGNVEGNSVIYATENVVVDGYVEGSTIRCGGDICLRQGVNGNGNGLIEAKGCIMGQFFEETRVVAGKDISVQYALNCEIYAEGNIVFHGIKGLLLGGYTRAMGGIQAYNVGNHIGHRTRLNVGVDDALIRRISQLDMKMENVKKELSILNNSYQDFQLKYPPEVRNKTDMFLKIENAIYTKELQLKGLQENRDVLKEKMSRMDNAKVVVHGVLYDGVEVVIDNTRWDSFSVKDVTIRCVKQKICVESN